MIYPIYVPSREKDVQHVRKEESLRAVKKNVSLARKEKRVLTCHKEKCKFGTYGKESAYVP